MKIYGIDFTSKPTPRKPLTCIECELTGKTLHACVLHEWHSYVDLEVMLSSPGPWIAGLDFPFGQARKFIEQIGWPDNWGGYVDHVRTLSRANFRAELDVYRAQRPAGDKEHRRATDIAAGSISPQKLYGVPVGLMFFEGAPRLRVANVTIPGLQAGYPDRVAVETYPGILARRLVGRQSYKQDTKQKQTRAQREARHRILEAVLGERLRADYGLQVKTDLSLAEDPTGDHLDALLCAVQAGWACLRKDENFGMPGDMDPLEGWIADPVVGSPGCWDQSIKPSGLRSWL
jgi:hypothetical protein